MEDTVSQFKQRVSFVNVPWNSSWIHVNCGGRDAIVIVVGIVVGINGGIGVEGFVDAVDAAAAAAAEGFFVVNEDVVNEDVAVEGRRGDGEVAAEDAATGVVCRLSDLDGGKPQPLAIKGASLCDLVLVLLLWWLLLLSSLLLLWLLMPFISD